MLTANGHIRIQIMLPDGKLDDINKHMPNDIIKKVFEERIMAIMLTSCWNCHKNVYNPVWTCANQFKWCILNSHKTIDVQAFLSNWCYHLKKYTKIPIWKIEVDLRIQFEVFSTMKLCSIIPLRK